MVRRLLILLNLLIITVVVYCGVDTFYKIAGTRLVSEPIVTVRAGLIPDIVKAKQIPFSKYTKDVVGRDLFHTVKPPETDKDAKNAAPPPDTRLKISLLGTIAGSPEISRALIFDKAQKKSEFYRIGEKVVGATIKEIMRGKVLLRVGNRDELLIMDEKSKDSPKRKSRRARGRSKKRSSDVLMKRGEVQNALRNINQLMSQVNVRPHYENGKPAGMMLRSIRPDSIFSKMGLKDGDVIQGVNDKDIKSADDVVSLYQNLKNSDNVALQIKRDGTPTSISYGFE